MFKNYGKISFYNLYCYETNINNLKLAMRKVKFKASYTTATIIKITEYYVTYYFNNCV